MSSITIEIANNFLQDAPQAAARLLELEEHATVVQFLQQAPVPDATNILLTMQAHVAGSILADLPSEQIGDIVSLLSVHQVSTLLRFVAKEGRERVLATFPDRRRLACKHLLQFGEDMVGSLVNTDIPVLSSDLTIEEGLVRIKKHQFNHSANVYVTDEERKLLGRIALADLLFENSKRTIGSLNLTPVPQLIGRTPVLTAIHHHGWNYSDTLAVINSRKVLVGVIDHHHLRHSLSNPVTDQNNAFAVGEMANAFTATMLGLMEVFTAELNSQNN